MAPMVCPWVYSHWFHCHCLSPCGLCPKGLVHMSVPVDPILVSVSVPIHRHIPKKHSRARHFKVFSEGCFFPICPPTLVCKMLSTNKSFVSSNLLSAVAVAIIVLVIPARNARVIAIACKSRVRRGSVLRISFSFWACHLN